MYRKRGRYQSAANFYERTRKAAPERADILNNEAAVYVKMDRPQQANKLLEQAVEINPNSSAIRFNQALNALHQGDLTKAKQYKNTLETMGAQKTLPHIVQGLIEAKQENWRAAEEAFDKAHTDRSQNPFAALNHGIALAKLKQYRKAEDSIRDAISIDPSLPASHRALGLLYCKLGLFEEALNILQISLQLDPSQEDLRQITNQIQRWIDET
jgi:tetratricopeptide (TPR) repeat protein